MRVDKYLKVSRLIKRRTVANDACNGSRIRVNDKIAKPSQELKIGDILEITFGNKSVKIQVIQLSEHMNKDGADSMYKVIEE